MGYRPEWLSEGAEVLVDELDARGGGGAAADFDVVIVGSGYGGAVAAARLARAMDGDRRLSVCLLERGREYVPGAFPSRFSDLPGHVRFSRYDDPESKGKPDGLFDFRIGAEVSLLVGNGLGGGSLINASVAERPRDTVFENAAWPAALRRDLDVLRGCFEKAANMLGVEPAVVDGLAKHAALRELGRAIEAEARPARVAIHSRDATNPQGVAQKACNRCGDCVTGCNFWAKNTLGMNYLAEAKRCGARLYTNATVSCVERAENDWLVHFRLTGTRHPPLDPPQRVVRARHVVLAAGALGSTEILLRSRARGLRLSTELGKRFSGNGDMISVLYGQRADVNAAPEETKHFEKRNVGPTITGIVESTTANGDRVVIEELSIPGPLRRLFEEIVTTAALPVELARFDRSTHSPGARDPAAVNAEAIGRTQIFGAMGNDGSRGRLEMIDGWESTTGDGAVRVRWEDAGTLPIYACQDRLLGQSERLGGLYLRNPLWRPLPEALAEMLSGPKPSGKLFTVHPLGGCAMGDDAKTGVVDDIGRVFDPSDESDRARTHDGLLVLDGSIVPTALEINPLLTIAALAERAIASYMVMHSWTSDGRVGNLEPPPAMPKLEVAPPPTTAVRFAERMTGSLVLMPGGSAHHAILDVEFDEIRAIPQFLRDGPHEVRIEKATLTIGEGGPVAVKGTVYWMERGRTRMVGRAARALWTWLRTRALADWFQRRRHRGTWAAIKTLFQGGRVLALATRVGERRYLRYEMELESELALAGNASLPRGTRIQGLKTFHYTSGGNPWKQLSDLVVTVTPLGRPRLQAGMLSIDAPYLLQRFAAQFQIVQQSDQPTAIIDVASIALFIARIAVKIHFWSFRAPEYAPFDPHVAQRRLPGPLEGLLMERHHVRVRARGGTETIVLPLSRYRHGSNAGKLPVLLIHGFGASGAQFTHVKLQRGLVRHLAEKGFDAWVAELRTSIAVPSSLNQWSLDEVAKEDIPAIVNKVLQTTGNAQLDVVAHCIGSAMFCTSVLAGCLAERVRRAVLLQVGPLITLSKGNQFRGYVASALRRYMLTDHVDSSVDDRADWVNAMIDRLLYTYPYPDSEKDAHSLWPWCKPHIHIANCNRSAAVFGRLFEHANVDEALLEALGDLLGHTNLKTFEQTVQYAFVKRLTDYDGCNSYVTDTQVADFFRFPVLFLHGAANDVFDPETTQRSQRLLKEIFGEEHPAEREVIPGYGHLDPLIGREAETLVFTRISRFLARAGLKPAAAARERPERYPVQPLIGPLLGWTRKEEGRWVARIWCRTDDEHSSARFLMAVVLKNGEPVAGHSFWAPLRATVPGLMGSLDLLGVIDVPLPDGPAADYEVVILGAHSSTASNMPLGVIGLERHGVDEHALRILAPSVNQKAQGSAEQKGRRTLDDTYGRAIADLRRTRAWADRAKESESARRVCDSGYDGRTDSIRLSKALLGRLEPNRGRIDFVLASCRYAASLLDREQADSMFGRLRDLLGAAESEMPAPSLLLLAGDQIYADATAGLFDSRTRRGRFYDSYREAWTAPNAREVLRRLPTYMMMDDHEAGDDWHPKESNGRTIRDWGIAAFAEYQLAHSPQDLHTQPLQRPGNAPAFHYSFTAAGFSFFVCDTRSGRSERSKIVSDEQFGALTDWLTRHNSDNRPKFVLSPSIVVPFLRQARAHAPGRNAVYAARSDGWDGFPDSFQRLFAFIAQAGISNIVFLCGDPHFSMASSIRIHRASGESLHALCIVGSPLYAPFPFANKTPSEFLGDASIMLTAAGNPARMEYSMAQESICTGDSFTLVSATQQASGWRVTASTYGREGSPRVTLFDLP